MLLRPQRKPNYKERFVRGIEVAGEPYTVTLNESRGGFCLQVEPYKTDGPPANGQTLLPDYMLPSIMAVLRAAEFFRPLTYNITYTVTTIESAQYQENEEAGYIVNCTDLPFPPELVGEASIQWHQDIQVHTEVSADETERTIEGLCLAYTGVYANGKMIRESQHQQDARTGEERTEAVHFFNANEEQIERITELCKRGQTWSW